MDNHQIDKILKNNRITSHSFRGTFALEDIPRNVYGIFVVNCIRRRIPMGHWVVLICKPDEVMFFDSFGLHPTMYDPRIIHYCDMFPRLIICNSKRLQNVNSLVCGVYCIYFIVQFCSGIPPGNIISPISSENTVKNDHVVLGFLYTMLGTRNKCLNNLCPGFRLSSICKSDCLCLH